MIDAITVQENLFTDDEKKALEEYKQEKGTLAAPLATSTAVKMYELFLLGHTCEEIYHANDKKFPLGMIVDARIRHQWDKRRTQYLDKIYSEATEIVKQRQTEGAVFLGDILAVAHKEHGPKFHKFLQTGNPDDLPETFKIDSIAKYVKIVDALIRITGQDHKDHPPASPVQVNVKGENVTLESKKTLSPMDAFETLRNLERLDALDKKKDKKDE